MVDVELTVGDWWRKRISAPTLLTRPREWRTGRIKPCTHPQILVWLMSNTRMHKLGMPITMEKIKKLRQLALHGVRQYQLPLLGLVSPQVSAATC